MWVVLVSGDGMDGTDLVKTLCSQDAWVPKCGGEVLVTPNL